MVCIGFNNFILGGGSTTNPKETVIISLTQIGGNSADLIGASVTITDDNTGDTLLTDTWNGSEITTTIDAGINYTVSVSNVTGYGKPVNRTYIALPYYARNINLKYAKYGVYIEDTDGELHLKNTWASSGKIANSVALVSSSFQYKIALVMAQKPIHSNYTDPITNYLPAAGADDSNGESNTDKLVQFNAAYGTNNTNYAAPYCKAYTFPDGKSKGYLPAFAELNSAYQNITAINDCMSTCGGTALPTSGSAYDTQFLWSSTVFNASKMRVLINSSSNDRELTFSLRFRIFSKLEL